MNKRPPSYEPSARRGGQRHSHATVLSSWFFVGRWSREWLGLFADQVGIGEPVAAQPPSWSSAHGVLLLRTVGGHKQMEAAGARRAVDAAISTVSSLDLTVDDAVVPATPTGSSSA